MLQCCHCRMGHFPGSDDHDSGEFSVSIKIAAKRNIDDHHAFILRRVHEMQNTLAITISQPNMLGKTFRSCSTDTDHVAVLNFGLDARNLALGDMVDCST